MITSIVIKALFFEQKFPQGRGYFIGNYYESSKTVVLPPKLHIDSIVT